MSQAASDPETQALLVRMERTPEAVVRIIATLQPGNAAQAAARRALRAASVQDVQRIEGRPMLVAEVSAAQLRALWGTVSVLTHAKPGRQVRALATTTSRHLEPPFHCRAICSIWLCWSQASADRSWIS